MKSIRSEGAPKPVGPYSQAVATGKFIFASGQIAVNPSTGNLIAGGVKEQTKQVLENLKAVLEAAGAGLAQVVKTTVFMTNLKEFTEMNAVYAEYFSEPFPARATVQAAALPLGASVEIEAVARVE